ncbi:uncharacterized protein LOC100679718 isoform X2 [Nasonia vitripennis]|nr:uncharacterized protein LOC100679718 isoform X2 [Nasonia vitripennis]XP_016841235.1 uncharacterized protein LOC100679718 isoform X2 [Nasonia vitripennis]XP_031787189.1 uncharacterized protein LOC100679718 isoform X2 [Nasonia vitripennis]XP_031787190.1 uncharacterized protein LOC100679718 isoform X2 [Nasonia vitripennis]
MRRCAAWVLGFSKMDLVMKPATPGCFSFYTLKLYRGKNGLLREQGQAEQGRHGLPQVPHEIRRGHHQRVVQRIQKPKTVLSYQSESYIHSSIIITRMEEFHQLMLLIGSPDDPDTDILKNLPIEIAEMILSMLDGQSLLNCALVSSKWLSILKRSPAIREKIRKHIRRKIRIQENLSSTLTESLANPPSPAPRPVVNLFGTVTSMNNASVSGNSSSRDYYNTPEAVAYRRRNNSSAMKAAFANTKCLRL